MMTVALVSQKGGAGKSTLALHVAAEASAHRRKALLVACRPSTFDLEAIRTTLDLCGMTKKPALVVLNAAPIRSRVIEEAEVAIRRDGGEVSPVVIRQRVAFQHGVIDGRTAAEFDPGGIAAQEIAALTMT
jgi:chromosome partitioning protein